MGPVLPGLPADVVGQWLYGHWDQIDILEPFIDLGALMATLESVTTAAIQKTNLGYDHFVQHYVPYFREGRVAELPEREAMILTYFREHGTWPRPVIFIHNDPPAPNTDGPDWGRPLHLADGHHRMAALLGLEQAGTPLAPVHQIWVLRRS